MNKQNLSIILFSALCMLMTGCDSIGTNTSSSASRASNNTRQSDSPDLINGRLTFQAKADFNTFFDRLIENQDPYDLDEFEADIKGFVSLRTVTNKFLYEEDEDRADESPIDDQEILRIVEDPVLESLLNQDGEIQIADSVYRVTRSHVYVVTAENADMLSGIQLRSSLPSKMHAGNDVTIVKINRYIAGDSPSKSNSVSGIQGRGECWESMIPGRRRKYRLKGSSWIIDWWFTRTFGSELEVQQIRKRGFRRWYHHQVQTIKLSGTFSHIMKNSSNVQFTAIERVNLTKYNAAEIRRTHARDPGKDEIFGANIQMTFYAKKTQYPADEVMCSSTRSWNW